MKSPSSVPSTTSPAAFDSADKAAAAVTTSPALEHYDGTPPAQIAKPTVLPSTIPVSVPDVPIERSWNSFLDYDRNLVIGEAHADITPKQFLVENMRLLKSKGFNTLFMEHLTQKEHQHLIDYYFKESEREIFKELEREMPPELMEYLDDLTKGQMDREESRDYLDNVSKYNFRTIIEEAKKAGVRVVCLETSLKDYKGDSYKSGVARTQHFNTNAVGIIEEAMGEFGGKWMAFTGNTHPRTYYPNNAGICEMLDNTQDLFIFDARKGEGEILRVTSMAEKFTRRVMGESDIKDDELDIEEYNFIASMVLVKKVGSSMAYNPDLRPSASSEITFGGAASSRPLERDAASTSAAAFSHIVGGTELSRLPDPKSQVPFERPLISPVAQRRSSVGGSQLGDVSSPVTLVAKKSHLPIDPTRSSASVSGRRESITESPAIFRALDLGRVSLVDEVDSPSATLSHSQADGFDKKRKGKPLYADGVKKDRTS